MQATAVNGATTADRTEQANWSPRVLVVGSDTPRLAILSRYLTERGHQVAVAESAIAALKTFIREPTDIIVSDSQLVDMTGVDLLGQLRVRDPEVDLVLLTARSSPSDIAASVRAGVADCLESPVDCRRLEHVIRMVIERRRLRQRVRILELGGQHSTIFEGMVARSRPMLDVFRFIERIAAYPTTTLITGESGTGKELVARAVHRRSPLRERPFVVCNCSALAPGVIESELFGHVRGAFTGADRDQKGLFESANGGTIFLDEIGELPLGAQVKLLRVLENREIRRVGSPSSHPVEIRVVAATNRNLGRMVEASEFREDLYYRLNVGRLELPPLRDRIDDLDLLSEHFLRQFSRKFALEKPTLAPETLERLRGYAWPGNVRELSNVLERASILAPGGRVQLDHLPPELLSNRAQPPPPSAASMSAPTASSFSNGPIGTLPAAVERSADDLSLRAAEREQIRRALDSAGGKRVAAARLLGLSRRSLYRKLEKHGLT